MPPRPSALSSRYGPTKALPSPTASGIARGSVRASASARLPVLDVSVFKIDSTAGKRPDLGTSVYRLDKPLPLARLIRGAISTIWIGLGSFPISVRHRVD